MLQPDKKVVSARFHQLLGDKKLSIAGFARLVGTDYVNAWKWVHGKTLAGTEWWPGICDVLDTSIDAMLAPALPADAIKSPEATVEEAALLAEMLPAGFTAEQSELLLKTIRRARAVDAAKKGPASSIPPPKRSKRSGVQSA